MKHTAEKKPSRPKGEDLRALRQEEILDAAARLFAEHGYADTDTQLLADDLGVGKGTLYRYFVNKEALFLAAVDRAMIMLRAQVDTGIARQTLSAGGTYIDHSSPPAGFATCPSSGSPMS